MLNPIQIIRRRTALTLLGVATGMLLWGTIVWMDWLEGVSGRIYWSVCAFAGLAGAWIALREIFYSLSLLTVRRSESLEKLARPFPSKPPGATGLPSTHANDSIRLN